MMDTPLDREFWDSRHRSQDTPWQITRVPAQLAHWLAAQPAAGAVLIPGCGSGPEISAFADAGWKVTAIDFSPTAIDRARTAAGDRDVTLITDDFFTHGFDAAPFDVIYERTFLTALGPTLWPACVERYRDLLRPEGRVVGYCYYGDEVDPPPYFQSVDAPPVLASAFDLQEDASSVDALPFFSGREQWQVWAPRRRES